jgi:hypothetical protein
MIPGKFVHGLSNLSDLVLCMTAGPLGGVEQQPGLVQLARESVA